MNISALPSRFARWVLVWFGLSLSMAVLGPTQQASAMEPICTSAGMVWMNPTSGDAPDPADSGKSVGLHCMLCSPVLTTQRIVRLPEITPALPLRQRLYPGPAVAAWHSRAPLPSRGPPLV